MPDYELYTVAVTEQAITRNEDRASRQVSSEGSVSGSKAATEPLGSDSGAKELSVGYKGFNAEILTQMVNELANNTNGLEIVPFAAMGTKSSEDGYYTIETERNQRLDPRYSNLPEFTGTMQFVGTRKNVWRTITTKQTQVENDYGNSSTLYVGVPAEAAKVKWYDGETATEKATVASTVTAEHGDIDRYNPEASSYTDPTLLYENPYSAEGPVDPKVWDERGVGGRTATIDGNEVLDWQKVFDPSHEFEGDIVLSNGRTRVTIDEDNRTMSAESYGSGTWSSLALGSTTAANNWVPLDVDIYYIGAARVTGQVEFLDTSDNSLFTLRFHMTRGDDLLQWFIPAPLVGSEGPTPTGLVEKLDPIASGRVKAANPESTVKSRSEVRP